MKILVYGVGAIGALMVHYLCRAGNDVTVVARSTYDELKNNGLVIVNALDKKKIAVDHPNIAEHCNKKSVSNADTFLFMFLYS